MTELEKRLETIPQNMLCIGSLWLNAIYEALESLFDVRGALMNEYANLESEILRPLPPTLGGINWSNIVNNSLERKLRSKSRFNDLLDRISSQSDWMAARRKNGVTEWAHVEDWGRELPF